MSNWQFPSLSSLTIQGGDMPGDKVEIGQSHVDRTQVIIPHLNDWLGNNHSGKTVISVYGGSGVGKSEIGSLLAYYLNENGFPSYLLSGDNYPRRIPEDNDRERLRVFRNGLLTALAWDSAFSGEKMDQLKEIWAENDDFTNCDESWNTFRDAGRESLKNYLGTDREIDFPLINRILESFKKGAKTIPLKRMGRAFDDLAMEPVDFSRTEILIIEWTHGNNTLLNGVDYPIFLYSTPEETLAHRRSRARDKGVDSPFVSMVLEIEQEKLTSQIPSASLIVSLKGEILP